MGFKILLLLFFYLYGFSKPKHCDTLLRILILTIKKKMGFESLAQSITQNRSKIELLQRSI